MYSTALKDLNWNGGDNLEELVTWGITPIKELVRILDEEIEEMDNDDPSMNRFIFVMYEMDHKIEELEEVFYRWLKQKINGGKPDIEKNQKDKKEA